MRYETHFNCFKLLGALPFSEARANALLPVIALAERHQVTGFDSQGQGVLPAPHGTHLRIQIFFFFFFHVCSGSGSVQSSRTSNEMQTFPEPGSSELCSLRCLAFVTYISHTDLQGLPFFLLSLTRSSQIAIPDTISETTDKTSVLLFINIEKQNPT